MLRLCAVILTIAVALPGCGGSSTFGRRKPVSKARQAAAAQAERDRRKMEFDPEKIKFDLRLERVESKSKKKWYYVYKEYKDIPMQRRSSPHRSKILITDYMPELGTVKKHCTVIGNNYDRAEPLVQRIIAGVVRVRKQPEYDSHKVLLSSRSGKRRYAGRMNRMSENLRRDYEQLETYLRTISDRATKMVNVDNNERKVTGWAESPDGDGAARSEDDEAALGKPGPRGGDFTDYVRMLQINAKESWIAVATRSPLALRTAFQKLTLSCTRCHAVESEVGLPDPDSRRTVKNLPLTTGISK